VIRRRLRFRRLSRVITSTSGSAEHAHFVEQLKQSGK